jgi:integrase
MIVTAKTRDACAVAICCAAVAMGTGCRAGEIRKLQIGDIHLEEGFIIIRRENSKNGQQREPRLTALAEWGLRNLLFRANAIGATEPHHYLLPLHLRKSKILAKATEALPVMPRGLELLFPVANVQWMVMPDQQETGSRCTEREP